MKLLHVTAVTQPMSYKVTEVAWMNVVVEDLPWSLEFLIIRIY